MADANTPMSPDAFLLYRAQYGGNIMVWPDGLREQAISFTATHDGMQLEKSEQALDAVFAQASIFETEQNDRAAEHFLSSLEAIPDQYPRPLEVEQTLSFFSRLSDVISRFFESGQLWTPIGVTAQAAVCAAILGVGMLVGIQQPMDSDLEIYDVSEVLFAANEQEFSFDDE
jgi:hypothetical protein